MAKVFGVEIPFSGGTSDENQGVYEEQLKEIHKSLDSDDDAFTSCGDSNCAGT